MVFIIVSLNPSFAQKKGRSKPETHKVKRSSSERGEYYNGHRIYTGPRGGKYYINGNGKKIYINNK